MKICSAETEMFRADGRLGGQTDTTKLIVAFRNLRATIKVDLR
jgi:hypothetical protein